MRKAKVRWTGEEGGSLIYTAARRLLRIRPPPSPIYAFEAEEIEITELREVARRAGGVVTLAATKTFPLRQQMKCRRCRWCRRTACMLWVSLMGGTWSIILSPRPDRIRLRSLNSISNLRVGLPAGRTQHSSDGQRGWGTACEGAVFFPRAWIGNPVAPNSFFCSTTSS